MMDPLRDAWQLGREGEERAGPQARLVCQEAASGQ